MTKILFLTPYPVDEAPSQRFRFEQYFKYLKKNYSIQVQPFFLPSQWRALYSKGNTLRKSIQLLSSLTRRLCLLAHVRNFHYIFIHREAASIGPPILEWVIAKVLRKRIIYDFDDAIWLTDKISESKIERLIRWRSKVASICKWSYRISCGNEYLANYARQFNPNVVINPTTIDTENLHKPGVVPKENTNTITIGWTGSHSTLKYLKEIEVALQLLTKKYSHVQVLVIADRKPDLQIDNLVFLRWNKETEAEDLLKIDIGIMPLPDDEWSKGKCGFKALQYMAMEIPCVASPVGVNKKIIDPGINGLLAENVQEWIANLDYLINNPVAREQLGKAGRKKVINNYSVVSNTSNFLSLFK